MSLTVKDNEILLIYDSDKLTDRQALAYAKSLREYVVKERDIARDPLTETQLKRVADRLGVAVSELVDRQSDAYQDKYQSSSISEDHLLIALKNEPQLLRTPIAVYPDSAEFVEATTFVKKGMAPPDITARSANPREK
jgi:arsenate reductase